MKIQIVTKSMPVGAALLLSSLTLPAATVTWGGAGSQASPEFWNLPVNGNPGRNNDPSHWGQATPPAMNGTDNAVINGGGLQKDNDLDFTGGSTMTLNLGAYFRRNTTSTFGFTISGGSGLLITDGQFDANVAFFTVAGSASYMEVVNGTFNFNAQSTSGFGINGGATVTVRAGGLVETSNFFNSQNANVAVGGSFVLDGGTLRASGAEANPLRAANGLDGGGFDFTSVGGTIQFDNFTGGDLTAYLAGRASSGFFKIDGTTATGFGEANAINGEWLTVIDNGTSGSLSLVPEPSTVLLGALGGLVMFRRRRF